MKQGTIVLACLLAGFVLLWERNTLLQLGLEIQELQKTEKMLLQAHQELLIDLSSLSSYRRIEKIAMTRMGMIRPSPQQVVMVIQEESGSGHDGPPSFGGAEILARLRGWVPGSSAKSVSNPSSGMFRSSHPNRMEDSQDIEGKKRMQTPSVRMAGGKDALELFGR